MTLRPTWPGCLQTHPLLSGCESHTACSVSYWSLKMPCLFSFEVFLHVPSSWKLSLSPFTLLHFSTKVCPVIRQPWATHHCGFTDGNGTPLSMFPNDALRLETWQHAFSSLLPRIWIPGKHGKRLHFSFNFHKSLWWCSPECGMWTTADGPDEHG